MTGRILMGLHFIFGAAGTGKTRRCCEEIRDYVTGKKGAPPFSSCLIRRHIPQNVCWRIFFRATVLSMPRSAVFRVLPTAFLMSSAPVQDALSPLGQQIIISRILAEHRDELQILMKISSQPHFAENLMNLFHQLDMFCISETALHDVSLAEEGTPLGRKLADLSSYIKITMTTSIPAFLMKAVF